MPFGILRRRPAVRQAAGGFYNVGLGELMIYGLRNGLGGSFVLCGLFGLSYSGTESRRK